MHVNCGSLLRNQSGLSPKQVRRGGDVPRSYGYSSSRRVRETGDNLLQRERSTRDPQAKVGVILRTRKVDQNELLS